MKRPVRLILSVILLVASLVLLAWAFWPGPRVVRRQFIQPIEMQLPTPESFDPLLREFVWEHQTVETACRPRVAIRFALIL